MTRLFRGVKITKDGRKKKLIIANDFNVAKIYFREDKM